MNKRDLLLEIGLEEVPARFLSEAINTLEKKIDSWLKERNIAFGEIQVFSTPRRLAVLVKDVVESQEDMEIEAKGPAKKIALDEEGNWSKAAQGFSRSNGMSVEDIYFTEIKGVEYAHVKKFIKGEKTIDLLPELAKLIEGLHFPNNMRWGSFDLRYVRPIRWIVALYGNETIPFSIAGVQTGALTRGHRFLGETQVHAATDYEKVLLDQYVIADYDKRKQMIQEQISYLGEKQNWVIPIDESLLDEVVNLVEYPTVFSGAFSKEFLELPEEVLITSMKEHQRYFPVKNENDELLPYFISVRNGNDVHIDNVARGNEKVLRARLADADFFYEEDQKEEIYTSLNKLESIVYHEKIGTLAEKVTRVRKIVRSLGAAISLTDKEKEWADRAAEISKFDLVTNMVNEFPELQGVMGEKYALQKGEQPEVARAINEHYQPRHADDEVPASTIGAVVSVADKLDSIVTSFAIGLIPTGSQDPYALRRQAAGVIQILLEKNWAIGLKELLESAMAIVAEDKVGTEKNLYSNLTRFFTLRMKHLLQEKGISHDIIDAVLGGSFAAVPELVGRSEDIAREQRSC